MPVNPLSAEEAKEAANILLAKLLDFIEEQTPSIIDELSIPLNNEEDISDGVFQVGKVASSFLYSVYN